MVLLTSGVFIVCSDCCPNLMKFAELTTSY